MLQLSMTITVFFAYTAAVRKEIQDETDRITGRSKQISNIPIHLSIYSPNGLYLRFYLIKMLINYSNELSQSINKAFPFIYASFLFTHQ